MEALEQELEAVREWMGSERFAGITRVYSPRQVVEQRGNVATDYTVARGAAEGFYARLRELFEHGRSITTFGPYSPGQGVAMKRAGIDGIYLGGWATSAKGSTDEDPGPDLASYPLSQVPDEAAGLVRALLTADRNQRFARLRMTDAERKATPEVDFRPFIIADADTGHGGDAHVRNLIRRFVEAGVPGYHIEDQKPGAKKCGHQGGKVLVPEDEQVKRLSAARFQLDIMGVPGIIVARTDAEAANLLDGCGDERDQPFILGVTNLSVPSYKAAYLALMRRLHRAGVEDINGLPALRHVRGPVRRGRGLARTGGPRSGHRPDSSRIFGWLDLPRGGAGHRGRPLPRGLAGRSRPEDPGRGRRRGDGLPSRRGLSARDDPRRVGLVRCDRVVVRRPREG